MKRHIVTIPVGASTVFEEIKDLDARLRVSVLASLQSFDEMLDAGELTEAEHRNIAVHLTKFKNEISYKLVEVFTSEPDESIARTSMILGEYLHTLTDEHLGRILMHNDHIPGTEGYNRGAHITCILERTEIDPQFLTFVLMNAGESNQ